MADTGSARRKRSLRLPVLAAAVLALFFLHVWTQVDPRLIHHRQQPVYLLGWEFFAEHLDRPGGLVEYAWAFLTQLHWVGWPGAAVLAALAGCAVLLTHALLAKMGRRADVLPVVPVVCLAVLANRYEHPMTTSIGFVAALATTNLYVWTAPRRLGPRVLLFVVLAMVLYYAAGGPMLLYAALAAIHELLAVGRESPTKGRRLVGLAYLAVGAAVPWAASAWLFIIPPLEAFARHLPSVMVWDIASLAAAVCLYAFLLPAAVWAAWPRKAADVQEAAPKGGVGRALACLRRTALGWATASLTLVAVGAAATWASSDGRERSLLYLDYCVAHGRWEETLAEARRLQTLNANTLQGVARALYHTGRLLEETFAFSHRMSRQVPPALHLFYEDVKFDRISDTLLAFGRVNEAEHIAHEALEMMGEQPPVLKRLVLVNVLKGKPEAAKRFLGVLDKTLWHREWAAQCRRKLDADPSLSTDARIRHVRHLMPTADRIVPVDSEEAYLYLLQANPSNQMAFEYLMLHYLLTRRLDRVIDHLGRIRHFNYSRLPRHLEEAILHHINKTKGRRPIDLHGHRIRPETVQQYQAFRVLLRTHRHDPARARDALKDEFGHTYWFFYLFAGTPFGQTPPPPIQQEGADE